jgi:hypothetical protein
VIFHLGTDIPVKKKEVLDHENPNLTDAEVNIISSQIRKNSTLINLYLVRLDLLVNKEKYPPQANFLTKIREKLDLLMDENDTFRDVLWKHYQSISFKEC